MVVYRFMLILSSLLFTSGFLVRKRSIGADTLDEPRQLVEESGRDDSDKREVLPWKFMHSHERSVLPWSFYNDMSSSSHPSHFYPFKVPYEGLQDSFPPRKDERELDMMKDINNLLHNAEEEEKDEEEHVVSDSLKKRLKDLIKDIRDEFKSQALREPSWIKFRTHNGKVRNKNGKRDMMSSTIEDVENDIMDEIKKLLDGENKDQDPSARKNGKHNFKNYVWRLLNHPAKKNTGGQQNITIKDVLAKAEAQLSQDRKSNDHLPPALMD